MKLNTSNYGGDESESTVWIRFSDNSCHTGLHISYNIVWVPFLEVYNYQSIGFGIFPYDKQEI